MPDESSQRRIDRLAQRAKALDDLIAKTAPMQKRIVEEIQRLGKADRVTNNRPTPTPKKRRKR